MNSKVIKIADLDQFEVNPEYKNIDVPEEEIQAMCESMALNYGKTVSVDSFAENCCVVCKAQSGEKVLIYPSLQIEGLEQAAADAKTKSVSETFTTVVKGKEMVLEVEAILVNKALSVDDDLAKNCGMSNVSSIDELRKVLTVREEEKKHGENVRLLVSDFIQYIIANSEVELDEEEVSAWAAPEAKRVFDEELSFGIDLRFTEEGEMITEEEALSRLAEELRPQFALNLIQKKFAQERGYVPSEEELGMGNPYDVYMYQTLTARAEEALS